jgi:hypothetical protein
LQASDVQSLAIVCIYATGLSIESLRKRLVIVGFETNGLKTFTDKLASLTANKDVITKNKHLTEVATKKLRRSSATS